MLARLVHVVGALNEPLAAMIVSATKSLVLIVSSMHIEIC